MENGLLYPITHLKGIKKGRLTASHRYNFTPLLRSRPGGLKGAGRTEPAAAKVSFSSQLANLYFK